MSELIAPARGFKLAMAAVLVLILRTLADVAVALAWYRADSLAELATVLRWMARLELAEMVALALLFAAVVSNLGELRRRRWPITAAAVALVAFALAFALHAWLHDLVTGAVAHYRDDAWGEARADELAKVPLRVFLATAALVIGLFAIVRVIRAYALTTGDLGLREQARDLGGMLLLLLVVDTVYRFSYGLGSHTVFGAFGLAAAVGLFAFWLWCYLQLGRLLDGMHYRLRHGEPVPLAGVVVRAPPPPPPPPAPATIASAAPPAPPVIAPITTAAPATEQPTELDGGPRHLR